MSLFSRELEHVCEVLDVGKKTQKMLCDNEIRSFNDVLNKKKLLYNDAKTESMCKAIEWYESFTREHEKEPDMLTDFSEGVFQDYMKKEREKACIRMFSQRHSDPTYIKFVNETDRSSLIINHRVNQVLSNMTGNLKSSLGNFDYKDYTRQVVNSIMNRKYFDKNDADNGRHLVVVAGRTQSGKSAVKTLTNEICRALDIAVVVFGKGRTDTIQLTNKVRRMTDEKHQQKVVSWSCPDAGGIVRRGQHKVDEVKFALLDTGMVVTFDSYRQVEKTGDALKAARDDKDNFEYAALCDEADALLCRTPDRTTKIENEFDNLIGKDFPPALLMWVTATPLPLLIEHVFFDYLTEFKASHLFNIEPVEEYFSINDMEPLRDETGKTVYLESKDLSWKNCYTSKHDELFLSHALSDETKKGVLIIDATNPRVTAEGNLKDKAINARRFCRQNLKRDVVMLINIGSGVAVLHPPSPDHRWVEKKGMDVDQVIEEIDTMYGLKMPILCFGFSKMTRGISYRSSRRFCTHTAVALGRAHNICNLLQTIGRGTGNGRSVLEENGFKAVTILAPALDLAAAIALQRFVDEIFKRIQKGELLKDAMTGANKALPDECNFLRLSPRKIGNIKKHRKAFQNAANFEDPPDELSEQEEFIRRKYWNDESFQVVLREICQLSKKSYSVEEKRFNIFDIENGLDNTYQCDEKIPPNMAKIQKALTSFVNDGLITELEKEPVQVPPTERRNKRRRKSSPSFEEKVQYIADYPRRLCRQYINGDLVLTQEEADKGMTISEVLGFGAQHDEDSADIDISNSLSASENDELSSEGRESSNNTAVNIRDENDQESVSEQVQGVSLSSESADEDVEVVVLDDDNHDEFCPEAIVCDDNGDTSHDSTHNNGCKRNLTKVSAVSSKDSAIVSDSNGTEPDESTCSSRVKTTDPSDSDDGSVPAGRSSSSGMTSNTKRSSLQSFGRKGQQRSRLGKRKSGTNKKTGTTKKARIVRNVKAAMRPRTNENR